MMNEIHVTPLAVEQNTATCAKNSSALRSESRGSFGYDLKAVSPVSQQALERLRNLIVTTVTYGVGEVLQIPTFVRRLRPDYKSIWELMLYVILSSINKYYLPLSY